MSVSRPLINKTSITNTSIHMSWRLDMENNGDFEIIGFNVTFIEVDSKKDSYKNMSTINEFFMDKLKPYTRYQLNVSAFNRFNVYSQNAIQQFITIESGKF